MKKYSAMLLTAALLAFPLSVGAASAPVFFPLESGIPEVLQDAPMPEIGENGPTMPEIEENKPPMSEVDENGPTMSEVEERESPPSPEKADYVLSLVNGLNVRTGAGTGYSSLGRIEKGVMLCCEGRSGGWYETKFKGETAYVSADPSLTATVSLACGGEETERVIAEGTSLLGVPYVYGAVRLHDGKGHMLAGFTKEEFDCSSLMQYIFYRGAGILLDVTTRTQIGQGERADVLRRGDLMFFTNASRRYNTGIERVGHVALYLGDNYILHTASDYAKIEQLSATRWEYFLEARRLLP